MTPPKGTPEQKPSVLIAGLGGALAGGLAGTSGDLAGVAIGATVGAIFMLWFAPGRRAHTSNLDHKE